MVTKEQVDKARAAYADEDAAAYAANAAAWADSAFDADAAEAAADAAYAARAAWDKYIKLKEEFENGN